MSDTAPKPESKPKRLDGPPKLPTKVTLDLMDDGEPPREDHPLVKAATALKNARTTWFELFRLDGGGRPLKRESLELSLDRNILLLSKALPELPEPLLEGAKITLQYIRDYRLRHPRTDPSNRQQAEEAQKALHEIQ
jgi:hypothetical protein